MAEARLDDVPGPPPPDDGAAALDASCPRREFAKLLGCWVAAAGLAHAAEEPSSAPAGSIGEIGADTLAEAEKIAGVAFTEPERIMMLPRLRDARQNFERLREIEIPNSVPPAIHFMPQPAPADAPIPPREVPPRQWDGERPSSESDLALAPAWRLAALVRRRDVSPVELVRLSIERLRRIGPKLNCVVTMMEEQALEEAKRAEREIAEGRHRGPLHGLPWGAKDLFATKGVRTTWGAKPFEDQLIDEDATVVERLREAGAILVAKLSLGELAMGDVWMEGRTNNPWNLRAGSSGSSAGPAAATAAGLVAFSIGTESLGSIVSPSVACGVTGLRPTFGRVSRHGAMALSWTMDKVGPICRAVEDCALAFAAIHGADGRDGDAVTRPFSWGDPQRAPDLSRLRIGYIEEDFERVRNPEENRLNTAALEKLDSLGARLHPISLPDYPLQAIRMLLEVEAAAAFDDLTRSGRVDQLRSQHPFAWPNLFRAARMIPAVEYLRAQRARSLLMRDMARVMDTVDLFVAPATFGSTLTLTNLTGHPAVVAPHGLIDEMPRGISFIGRLYDEETILSVALAFQEAGDWLGGKRPDGL